MDLKEEMGISKRASCLKLQKDGVTVAKEVEPEDAVENMGAQMLKEAPSKTADIAGDGNDHSYCFAQAMVTAEWNMLQQV